MSCSQSFWYSYLSYCMLSLVTSRLWSTGECSAILITDFNLPNPISSLDFPLHMLQVPLEERIPFSLINLYVLQTSPSLHHESSHLNIMQMNCSLSSLCSWSVPFPYLHFTEARSVVYSVTNGWLIGQSNALWAKYKTWVSNQYDEV